MLSWNTWDASYPACLLDPATGLAIRLSAFSAAARRATDFRYDAGIRLGPHLSDGSYAELELQHAGSRVRLRSATEGEVLVGEVEAVELAEWGLRFWPLLEFGFERGLGVGGDVSLRIPEGEARYVLPPVALAETAGRSIAFSTGPRPVAAHLYGDGAEALEEFERLGYYYRPPSLPSGERAVFRFNFVTTKILFAVVPGVSEDAAR